MVVGDLGGSLFGRKISKGILVKLGSYFYGNG